MGTEKGTMVTGRGEGRAPPCGTECGDYIPDMLAAVYPPVILSVGAGPVGLGRELPDIQRVCADG